MEICGDVNSKTCSNRKKNRLKKLISESFEFFLMPNLRQTPELKKKNRLKKINFIL